MIINVKEVQLNAKETLIFESGYIISKVIDGDGIIVKKTSDNQELEIRLYGIDAPEIKRCRKLREDEQKLRLPGQFLIQLGYKSFKFLRELAPIGIECTLGFEKIGMKDFYKRTLAYVYIESSISLNEIMIEKGYARPLNEYYCYSLQRYQKLNFIAKKNGYGLYKYVDNF